MNRIQELKRDCHEKMAGEMCDHLAECWKAEEYQKVKATIVTAPPELKALLRNGVAARLDDGLPREVFHNYLSV